MYIGTIHSVASYYKSSSLSLSSLSFAAECRACCRDCLPAAFFCGGFLFFHVFHQSFSLLPPSAAWLGLCTAYNAHYATNHNSTAIQPITMKLEHNHQLSTLLRLLTRSCFFCSILSCHVTTSTWPRALVSSEIISGDTYSTQWNHWRILITI